jgi:predicted NodU family carbamoyl transferase|tara:strand:+ start:300 stop:407 length:108 start_codon:yes stop_codon:yes gene_type:complete
MIILGINDTHDASACLVKDGKLLIAVEEENLINYL